MDNTTVLLIRACKSFDSATRIQSVYRRFYCGTLPASINTINHILSSIVEKYNLINTMELCERLNPSHPYFYNETLDYNERLNRVLTSVIRLSPVTEYPNLPKPRRFRKD